MLSADLDVGTALYNLYTPQVTRVVRAGVFGPTGARWNRWRRRPRRARFQLDATYLTLTANVVTAAIQEAGAAGTDRGDGARVALERESSRSCVANWNSGQWRRRRLGAGGSPRQLEGTLPPLHKQLHQSAMRWPPCRPLAGRLCGAPFELA